MCHHAQQNLHPFTFSTSANRACHGGQESLENDMASARERASVSHVKPLILTKEGGSTYAQLLVRKGGEDLPEQFLPSYLGPQD